LAEGPASAAKRNVTGLIDHSVNENLRAIIDEGPPRFTCPFVGLPL